MPNLFEGKEQCCGCTACVNICPKHAICMEEDNEGFLYPYVNNNLCVECNLCVQICDFKNEGDKSKDLNYPEVYAAKHIDEEVREKSTSGGAFTALSDFILQIDGFVCGVGFDKDMNACHMFATSKKDRDKFRGSKYVQSELRNTFKKIKELLELGRWGLFTGTPCQTAGLKKYLKDSNIKRLYICDIVCHGVPSPLIFKEYIRFLEKKRGEKVINYYCRDKSNGWRKHTEKAVYRYGYIDYKSNVSKIYKEMFQSNNILRPACHYCKYTSLKRCSDITIADFWGIEKSNPDFDDNRGTSLVLINTDKGRWLFNKIDKNLIYRKCSIDECLQPQLQYPSEISKTRNGFWIDYNKKGFNYVARKYTTYGYKFRMLNKVKCMCRSIVRRGKRS